MKAYRVENQEAGHGIWRNFDGSLNPVFAKLSDGQAKNLPMPDSDYYREGGKQWFSATDTPEKLTAWFSLQDVLEMLAMGYEVLEFEITDCRTVSEFEIVFTRDSIVSRRAIDYRGIWGMRETMTPERFLEEVRQIGVVECGDVEALHGSTDNLMEELLISLGYGEGVELIRSMERWYA